MSQDSRKVRFGLWYDFRNPPQWRQPSDQVYGEILDQIVWGENNGFDDVWLSEHHLIEDGYLPSTIPGHCPPDATTVGSGSFGAVRVEGDPRVSLSLTSARHGSR